MATFYIGTSGYDYPDWRGVLYPQELPREQFLACYADQFNALELNYTYYGMPEAKHMDAMIKRSGSRLHFSVKAHRSLTHDISLSKWRDEAARFCEAMRPLQERKLLLSVLFQFPESFHYQIDERRYLDDLVRTFAGFPLTIEFRHASWQQDRVYQAFRKKGLVWCITDMPALKTLPAQLPVVTAKSAYIRFHGRNAAQWYRGNATTRYDYQYSDEELSRFIPFMETICHTAQVVQVFFNNHAKGQAVVNARKMKILAQNIFSGR